MFFEDSSLQFDMSFRGAAQRRIPQNITCKHSLEGFLSHFARSK